MIFEGKNKISIRINKGWFMSERMKRKKEERRNEILDIAEEMIAKKGIKGMTMKEVAKEADVATGTLYLYFKNKNSLCAAVNARISKQMRVMAEERLVGCKTACEKFKATTAAGLDFRSKYPDKWRALNELFLVQYDIPDENIDFTYSTNKCNPDLYDFQGILDENIVDLLNEDKKMLQLTADKYDQGIEECSIRPELDILPTIIFIRMAFFAALDPPPYVQRMLKMGGISQEHFQEVSKDLIRHSVRVKHSEEK